MFFRMILQKKSLFLRTLLVFTLATPSLLHSAEVSCGNYFSENLSESKKEIYYSESTSVKHALKTILRLKATDIDPKLLNEMPFTLTHPDAHNFFQNPIYLFRAQLTPSPSVKTPTKTDPQTPLFESSFHIVPPHFYERRLNDQFGVNPTSHVLLLQLPETEFSSMRSLAPRTHISAFAYLRFYIKNGNLFVTEIQSDYYRQLSPDQKSKYKNWSRTLVLAFESYAQFLVEKDVLKKSSSIFITDGAYQMQRWPELRGSYGEISSRSIHPNLAHVLYHKLPQSIGYDKSHETFPGYEWPNRWDDKKVIVDIANPWEMKLQNIPKTPTREVFQKSLTIFAENSFDLASADHTVLPALAPVLTQTPFSNALDSYPSFPITEIFLNKHPQWKTTYQRLQNVAKTHGVTEFQSLFHLANISLPTFSTTETRTDHGFSYASTYQPFPYLTLQVSSPQSALIFSVKGVGTYETHPYGFTVHKALEINPHISIPFKSLTNLEDIRAEREPRFHGALKLQKAVVEFENALALHDLYLRAYNKPAPAPLPNQILRLDFIPTYEKAILKMAPVENFTQTYFRKNVGLAQYNYFSHSEVRVQDLQNLILKENSIDTINSYLQRVYQAHGFKLRLRTFSPSSKLLDPSQTLQYLRSVYELNKNSTEQILATFYKNSLSAMGLVHGSQGHLGGQAQYEIKKGGQSTLLDSAIGAKEGGATKSININIYGELLELSEYVYFPWNRDRSVNPLQKEFLEVMQLSDLHHWNHSAYFFELALKGRSVASGLQLSDQFLNPNTAHLTVPYESRKEWEQAPLLPTYSETTWNRPELKAIYKDAVQKGLETLH